MSSPPSQAFWVCHECGAQMRPIMVDGVAHCASCNGEFIEILDSNVNPDPFHELPMPPPTRPTGESSPPVQHWNPAEAGFLPNIFGNMFGSAGGNLGGGSPTNQPPGLQRQVSNPDRSGSRGNAGRSFTFNVPGGGRGQVMFGSFGGPPVGGQNGNPFGDQRDLGSFFPGFGPPPTNQRGGAGGQFRPLGRDDAMTPEDLMRSLFAALQTDDFVPMQGPAGNANLGDYVLSQNGFDQVLEQLMRAAGPQGPLPASDIVINGLPKFKLTEESLEASQFKDCPVCKDDFSVGEEVKRIPCKHIFHPDCVDPWLKVNGSCPVCRFSLVPDESNGPPQSAATASPPTANTNQGGTYVGNILRRLWGPTGTESAPTSPTTETGPSREQGSHTPLSTTTYPPPAGPPPTSSSSHSNPLLQPPDGDPLSVSDSAPPSQSSGNRDSHVTVDRIPTSIPAEYRDRHRRREQESRDLPPDEDLD